MFQQHQQQQSDFGMTIDQLKSQIDLSDCQRQELEVHLDEERKLNSLRKNLLDKIEDLQREIDQESLEHTMNTRQKTELIAKMQTNLYDLQLVEHASKTPLIQISKILFSTNPDRCVQKESSPTKSKPPKRRKNELCCLDSNPILNDDIIGIKRTREPKLFPVSVDQLLHQNEDRFEFEEPGTSYNPGFNSKKGARIKRRARIIKNTPPPLSPPTDVGDKEDEQGDVQDEEDRSSSQMLKSPSPIEEFTLPTSLLLHIPASSPQKSTDGQQQTVMHSPPGTRARKRGKDVPTIMTEVGIPEGRNHRKRGAERQRNDSETEAPKEADDCDGDAPIPVDEPTYCICEQVSFGDMICCDYELCPIEWFHFSCVNIKSKPKGKKWFCPLCRLEKPNLLKPELQQKLDHIKKIQSQ